MTADAPVSAAAFGRLAGFKPRYVRELKMAGRLVLTEDGKRIIPQASLARIEETRDNPPPRPQPAEASFSDFAALIDCRPSYVTELRQGGRLVLTEDGKRVRVAESIALIESTRDPAKAGVAERHAAERAQAAARKAQAPQQPVADAANDDFSDDAEDPATFVPKDPHSKRRAKALADKAEADARKALRDEKIELGQLLQAEEVAAVVSEAVTTLRTSMENLPGQIAPGLAAATTEEQVRVLLAEALETRLADLARTFTQIGRAEA